MAKWLLYALLFSLMVIWGFNVIAIKTLVNSFPPIFITSLRVMVAGFIVVAFLLFKKSLKKIPVHQFISIMVASLFGVLGHHVLLALGLTKTTASNAGLILGLVPLATSVFAIIFLGERLTRFKFSGIVLAFAGVSFIILNGSGQVGNISLGDFLILACVIAQAISFVLIKKLTESMDSRQVTGLMLLCGSFLLLIVSLFFESGQQSEIAGKTSIIWSIFFASAIFATGLGHMLYNHAIGHLGAGETAVFINLTPFFAIVGSALFLGEMIKVSHILGFVLIITGVILGTGTLEPRLNTRRRLNNEKGLSS